MTLSDWLVVYGITVALAFIIGQAGFWIDSHSYYVGRHTARRALMFNKIAWTAPIWPLWAVYFLYKGVNFLVGEYRTTLRKMTERAE